MHATQHTHTHTHTHTHIPHTHTHIHTLTHTCTHTHRTHANVLIGEADSFHVNHVYKDDDTYSVVAAASEVLGKSHTVSFSYQ